MEPNDPKKSPYRGLWVALLLMVGVPLVLYLLLRESFIKIIPGYTVEYKDTCARAIGLFLGTLFHLGCFISGAFENALEAVKNRMTDFRMNLSISFGFALKCYLEDMKSDGVVLIIILSIVIANCALWIDAICRIF